MLYSVIIPCYKSSQTIRKVVEETMQEFVKMNWGQVEFVLVDDCSPDNGATVLALRGLVRDYPNVKAVELAFNSGQHNALMAGLNYAGGDYIISMDDDGQTRPSQLPLLFQEINKGYDVVWAYFPQKKHSKGRNLGSRLNQFTLRAVMGKPKEVQISSFWIIRRFVRDYAIMYRNPDTRISGVFLRITKNVSSVAVEHYEREVGKSGYTLKKLVKLWLNIMSFSVFPLHLAVVAGNIISAAGFIGIIIVIIRKIIQPQTAIGWSSILVSILFFSGLIVMFLGLIGEYVGRIYLGISSMPQFVVRQVDENKTGEAADSGSEYHAEDVV